MLRRTLTAKEFTLMRLQHAFQHFPTLGGFGIGDSDAGNLKALFRIPFSVLVVDTQCGLRDESQTAPLKIRAQLKNFGHRPQGCVVAFPGNYTFILILNLGFPPF